jgi:hypothetical protein
MTLLSLLIAVLALLARLPLLTRDRPILYREAFLAWSFQVGGLLLLTRGLKTQASVVIVLLGLHLLWRWLEMRQTAALQSTRLLFLGLSLLVASCVGSPGWGLTLRDHAVLLMRLQALCTPLGLLAGLPWRSLLITVFGILLAVHEANAVIRWAIERLSLRPKVSPDTGTSDADMDYRRGRVIGVLERLVVFVLVLHGQYTALAFVITAKSMARFKSLDDREFAEYFLLGTLLSVVLAGGSALAVKAALGL